jgi:hypothetical protein
MGFSHGYHHEKDGLGLLAEDDFLLSLCFCPHCLTRATAAGVPARGAQAQVAGLLQAALARELPAAQFPDFPARGLAAFEGLDDLAAYLRWRREPVTSLVAEIAAGVPAATQLLLIDFEGSWMGGVDLAACAPHLGGALYCAYVQPPERIPALLAPVRAALGDKALIAGFQLFHPNVRDAADLAARVAAARPTVQGFNFYNLGLVPPARLAWISRALQA